MTIVYVASAGAAGAVARVVVDGVIRARLRSRVPWATLAINVSGSLLLGLVTGAVLFRSGATELTAIIGVGFCGGYTTFSTASVETVRLLQRRHFMSGMVNSVVTLVLSMAAAGIGLALMSLR